MELAYGQAGEAGSSDGRADDVDPDQLMTGFRIRRIVGKTIPVYRYDPKLPAWNYYVPLAKLFLAASIALNEE